MPKQKRISGISEIEFDPGKANPKQLEFFTAKTFWVCYGGAKAGGKTWAVQRKAVIGALGNPGIKILIMRAHYPELEVNHIRPICQLVSPLNCASYNGSSRILSFSNGSMIKFGHWSGEESELEYNGTEWDWIFVDEATQFSERAINFLVGCIRGVNEFSKHIFLTCNPGGVGHFWVKRLFIDKDYRTDPENPELTENPEDYTFIFATVEDNEALVKANPMYLKSLANMPNAAAYRYGDWDALGGNYFKEFSENTHTCRPFKIPDHWPKYRSFDYGLDMFACFWWAVDEDGRSWCYRSYECKDLNVQDAAAKALELTLPGENIDITYAPPDMWSRQKVISRTMADVFAMSGLPLLKVDNNRVQGHMIMKNMMLPIPLKDKTVQGMFPDKKELPALMFFDTIRKPISDIKSIQADEDNPNDCAKDPHEITHTVDGIRYYCITRIMEADPVKIPEPDYRFYDDDEQDYEDFLFGGEITDSYMSYGVM